MTPRSPRQPPSAGRDDNMAPCKAAYERAAKASLDDPGTSWTRTIRDPETGQTWVCQGRCLAEMEVVRDFVGVTEHILDATIGG